MVGLEFLIKRFYLYIIVFAHGTVTNDDRAKAWTKLTPINTFRGTR